MSSPKLDDVMDTLLKISKGDVEVFARANAEFTLSITRDAKLPLERVVETVNPEPLIKDVVVQIKDKE